MLSAKNIALGFSVGLGLPLLYSLLKAGKGAERKLENRLFVGIEIGVNNYNVGIAEPILNKKGKIADFNIVKRKNGLTGQTPEQTLQEIIRFIR